jgi:hypothetical protein
MLTPAMIFGMFTVAVIALLTYFVIREGRELHRIASELRDRYKKLLQAHIEPQSDWPAWARKKYETYYKEYRKVFTWCGYRLESIVISRYTISILDKRLYWLHNEQKELEGLVKNIEKYRKVPEVKKQVHERLETFRSQVELLGEKSTAKNYFENLVTRLEKISTDNQDDYPEVLRRLQNFDYDFDWLQERLNKENTNLRVA